MAESFKDKVALITGSSQGIGAVIAEVFAAEGCLVYVNCAHGVAKATAVVEKIRAAGGAAELLVCDISSEEEIATRVREIKPVDILINNACRSHGGVLSGCSYDDFLDVLKVGVAAPYYLTLLFKAHFRPGASVINISSTRASQSQRDTESYSAAKGGIASLTHALAMSLAGVARVNAIAPGWIDTREYHLRPGAAAPTTAADRRQHSVGRIGRPEDIAGLAAYLCQEESSFINGECITVDGGMSKQMIYHGDEGWSFSPPAKP